MKTFKFSLVLRTREYTDVFITFDENIYGIHNKRVNILYGFLFISTSAAEASGSPSISLVMYILQIKIEALNDSRQIGMCIYNAVVLSAVGLTLTLLLEDQVDRLYGVTSGCILIGTTATQLIVFIPKVR